MVVHLIVSSAERSLGTEKGNIPMRSVGLDWAVDPCDRAAVVLEQDADGAFKVATVDSPVRDEDAQRQCTSTQNHVVAVDIPFAWPRSFTEFVSDWAPLDARVKQPPESTEFRYRTTDRFVHEQTTKWPLSVSSNLFALGARQWANVVHEASLGCQMVVTKTCLPETKPYIIEVYPAATLKVFENHENLSISGLSTRIVEVGGQVTEKKYSYKTDESTRQRLVDSLIDVFQLRADDAERKALVGRGKQDHGADALLAALTGLMFLGVMDHWTVREPVGEQLDHARIEGWIFFPEWSVTTSMSKRSDAADRDMRRRNRS